MGFNPSTGLSVFQTRIKNQESQSSAKFQSLDWVERLSDQRAPGAKSGLRSFQSLDWVERLSDPVLNREAPIGFEFQSLDWVERLSDSTIANLAVQLSMVSIPRLG